MIRKEPKIIQVQWTPERHQAAWARIRKLEPGPEWAKRRDEVEDVPAIIRMQALDLPDALRELERLRPELKEYDDQ